MKFSVETLYNFILVITSTSPFCSKSFISSLHWWSSQKKLFTLIGSPIENLHIDEVFYGKYYTWWSFLWKFLKGEFFVETLYANEDLFTKKSHWWIFRHNNSVQKPHISKFKKNLELSVVFYRKYNYHAENIHICDIFYGNSSFVKLLFRKSSTH